jgi:hypothetical protein
LFATFCAIDNDLSCQFELLISYCSWQRILSIEEYLIWVGSRHECLS